MKGFVFQKVLLFLAAGLSFTVSGHATGEQSVKELLLCGKGQDWREEILIDNTSGQWRVEANFFVKTSEIEKVGDVVDSETTSDHVTFRASWGTGLWNKYSINPTDFSMALISQEFDRHSYLPDDEVRPKQKLIAIRQCQPLRFVCDAKIKTALSAKYPESAIQILSAGFAPYEGVRAKAQIESYDSDRIKEVEVLLDVAENTDPNQVTAFFDGCLETSLVVVQESERDLP